MKASVKFREDQRPLFRAKIPLNISSFRFQSGIIAGESKEFSMNLATLFDSGPSLKFCCRPNNPRNPFSLIFKTGIGYFGSPIGGPFTISAEFNLIGSQNPSFFIHFKPKFGDFSVRKSLSSDFSQDFGVKSTDSVVEGGNYLEPRKAARRVEGFLKGTEVSTKATLPVWDFAVLNFRWGLWVPPLEAVAEGLDAAGMAQKNYRTDTIGLPLLVMNKIGIENLAKRGSSKPGSHTTSADVAETCLDVKRQLRDIQTEKGLRGRPALRDVKFEMSREKVNNSSQNEDENNENSTVIDEKSSDVHKGF